MNALSTLLTSTPNLSSTVKALFEKKGYGFLDGEAQLKINIIAVRSTNENPDKFDDGLLLIYNDAYGQRLKIYDLTTYPASFYLRNPLPKTGGAGVLAPGHYPKAFGLGTYSTTLPNGSLDNYTCLTQVAPLTIYHDKLHDGKLHLEPKTIQTGMFEIRVHRAAPKVVTASVARWSTGDQVFADAAQYDDFMSIIQKAYAVNAEAFNYTLIGQQDLLI